MLKREQIPDDVWRDLTSPEAAEYKPEEVLSWSPEELFEKYCEWHGLLGWHGLLWRVVTALAKIE